MTTAGCEWNSESNVSWIGISGGSGGTGSGTVTFVVAENNTPHQRTGVITISGSGGFSDDFTIIQNHPWIPVNFEMSTTSPAIGETVILTTDDRLEVLSWSFTSEDCRGNDPVVSCSGIAGECAEIEWAWADSGVKEVVLETTTGFQTKVLTVRNTGECPLSCAKDGPPDASFDISPSPALEDEPVTFTDTSSGGLKLAATGLVFNPASPEIGELVTFSISGHGGDLRAVWDFGENGCSGYPQIQVCEPAFSNCHDFGFKFASGGSKTVSVTVKDPSTGVTLGTASRAITVQDAGSCAGGGGGGGGGGGDTTPTEWRWTVRLGAQVIVTSTEQNFTHTFRDPGLYEIELIASNCAGSDTVTRTLQVIDVIEPAPDAYLIPSAVHAPGLNQTLWKTDLWIFNPGDDNVEVEIVYLPENTDNTQGVINAIWFSMESQETRVFSDVANLIPGIQGDSKKGSLRITFGEGTEVAPRITSRTYNDTPAGTFGQFVPAVPIVENQNEFLLLTGLAENLYSRTNLSLANFSDQRARGVTVNVLDDRGEIIGDTINVVIQPWSTTQIVKIAEHAGVLSDLDVFSLYVNANGHDLWAGASIVDNATGDPVLVEAVDKVGEVFWVPGIAHLNGANDSVWRSDITFFNNTIDWIEARVEYISPENVQIGGIPGMTLNLASANAAHFVDVLGASMLPAGTESMGYFVVTRRDDSPLPQVVARTYNVDELGGTFGQNLKVFGDSDLIDVGETGCMTGVSNSSDSTVGFRTNVGVLNTSDDNVATVEVNIYDTDGVLVGRISYLPIGREAMLQSNIFESAHIGDLDMDGSVEIKVLSGGPVAAYASVIDNRTQDPILIPAVVP